MLNKNRVYIPLVIDPDRAFLSHLKEDAKSTKFQPYLVEAGTEAQKLLADPELYFSGVFVNPEVSRPGGISVIKFCRQIRPGTPVFLICNQTSPFTDKEAKSLGIQKVLFKPLKYSQFIEHIAPPIAYFNPTAAVEVAKQNKDILDKEITAEDSQFSPIRADGFLSGCVSSFDIYIRLSSGRYIKLLQAGNSFTNDRLETYLKKGVTTFYIRKEAQEHYLSYCDTLVQSLLNAQKVSPKLQVSQTMNHGEELFHYFCNHGLSEASLQYAANFLSNVESLVRTLDPGTNPLLGGFLNDLSSYEHGVATTIVTSLLLPGLNITALDPLESIGFSCFFHDIGLYQLNFSLDEDETKMSEEEKKIYWTHPNVGAEVLASIRQIRPAAVQAVSQHHERRNKTGFPNRLGVGNISLVAELIAIGDEFIHIINNYKKNPTLNIADEVQKRIINVFSQRIVTEFRRVFLY